MTHRSVSEEEELEHFRVRLAVTIEDLVEPSLGGGDPPIQADAPDRDKRRYEGSHWTIHT